MAMSGADCHSQGKSFCRRIQSPPGSPGQVVALIILSRWVFVLEATHKAVDGRVRVAETTFLEMLVDGFGFHLLFDQICNVFLLCC